MKDRLIFELNSLPRRATPGSICSDRRERYGEEDKIDRLNALEFSSHDFIYDEDVAGLLVYVPPENFPYVFPYFLRGELSLFPEASEFFGGLIYGLAENQKFSASLIEHLSKDELVILGDYCTIFAGRVSFEGLDCGTKVDAAVALEASKRIRDLRK